VKKRIRTPWVLLAAAAAIVPSALMATQASSAKAATTVSGSFAFLNYNVAGLPVVQEPPTTL
jgi:hypothetical protein